MDKNIKHRYIYIVFILISSTIYSTSTLHEVFHWNKISKVDRNFDKVIIYFDNITITAYNLWSGVSDKSHRNNSFSDSFTTFPIRREPLSLIQLSGEFFVCLNISLYVNVRLISSWQLILTWMLNVTLILLLTTQSKS